MNDFEAMRDYLLACADEPEPVSLGDALDRLIAATGEGEWETPYGTVCLRNMRANLRKLRMELIADGLMTDGIS